MKRFLSAVCLVFLLFAGGVKAYAAGQFCDSANICNYSTQAAADAASAAYAANNEAPAGFLPAPAASPSQTAYSKPTSATQPTSNSQYDGIMTAIMGLFAWLLGVAMLTLDASVYYTVIHMGNLLSNNNGGLAAVGVAWRILRDIGNIVLIFGFLALGIETILGINFYGGGMKMLPILLLSAVLLNFSLFISEAVIDVGNLFATEFFVQINDGQVPQPASFTLTSVHNEGVSDKIMSQLGLQSIYGAALKPNNTDIFKGGNVLLIGFMGVILFLIAAFVMFTLAFILIARFVALVFIIVVAPIGIAGLAVPKLESLAKKWWGTLFEQTVTAPVLLLMLYVALAVITDGKFLTGFGVSASNGNQSAWTGFVKNGDLPGFAGLMLSFIVAMGLLLAVTVIAKKMSAAGAGAATKWGSRLSGVGLAMAVPGAVGRNTLGRGSHWGADRVRRSSFGRSAAGRLVAGGLDRGAKATYDPRNTSGVKAGAGALLKGTGLNLGTGTKANFAGNYDKSVKANETYAKSLKNTDDEEKLVRVEEGRKAMMERTVKEIERQRDEEMGSLSDKHKVDMQSYSDEVKKKKEALTVAENTGVKANVDSAQLALNNALRDQEQKRKDQEQERSELKGVHDQMIKVQKEEVEAHQREIERLSRAPKEDYARNIEKSAQTLNTLTGGMYRLASSRYAVNRFAAAAIRKDAKTKKSDKDLEILRKALAKEDEDKSGGEKEKGEKGEK